MKCEATVMLTAYVDKERPALKSLRRPFGGSYILTRIILQILVPLNVRSGEGEGGMAQAEVTV